MLGLPSCLLALVFVAYAFPSLQESENAREILTAQIEQNEAIYKSGKSPSFFPGVEAYQFHHKGVAATVLGHTSTCDPGVCARIVDRIGVVNMNSGALGPNVIVDSVVESEAVSDGLSGYDAQNNQAFFVSDGAFGGTVFFAQVSNFTSLPASAYYLLPVALLGFDPVSGTRIIAGKNINKNFFIMEKPNWGAINYFQMPASIPLTANAVYDGLTQNYYNFLCPFPNPCQLSIWNIMNNSVTNKGALPCMPKSAFLDGPLWVNPSVPRKVFGLQSDQDTYSVVTIDPFASSNWCTVSGPLSGMPPKPRIIVATAVGQKTSNLYMSVTGNNFQSINVYDTSLKLLKQTLTNYLYEDLFVAE